MDRDWLERELRAGLSLEAIGREVGRHPSSVGYWVRKHGLRSAHADAVAPRGGISRERLSGLVARDLTVREIAAIVDRSATTVRHWLRRHGLSTTDAARRRPVTPARLGTCPRHGPTPLVGDRLRCPRCRSEHVSNWRRRAKLVLVAEAGGACVLCGYARTAAALQFHHTEPSTKRYSLSGRGLTRSLADLREEASKCVLLCANCHAEVGAGVAKLPVSSSGRG